MLRKFSTSSGVDLEATGGDDMIPEAAMGIHTGTSIGCQDCKKLKDGASLLRLSNTITFTLLFTLLSHVQREAGSHLTTTARTGGKIVRR